jgi:hypothetical protein
MPKYKILKLVLGILCVIVLFLLINTAWVSTVNYYRNKEPAPSPGAGYELTESELIENKVLAEKGNIKAMHNLWLYYGVYMDTPDTEKDFEYWGKKITEAAKAGDLEARNIFPDWENDGKATK